MIYQEFVLILSFQDGGDSNIFKQQLLQERSTQVRAFGCLISFGPSKRLPQAAKNALADIQDKHKDIMRLEQVR